MNTEYVQTFNSFFRNGKYPLEADYIFDSEEALKLWEEDNKKYLHDGLFKVVVAEDKQTLYWFYNNTFVPLITSESLENIAYLLKDFELHGQLRDLLRDLQNSTKSKLNALQQELDQTQAGAGLNGDGSFDQLNMRNTTYLDGSKSIIEALKALDREMSNLVVGSFIKDAYYDSSTEEIVITFVSDTEKVVRIPLTNLIREWEPDNTSPTKVVEITREEIYGSGSDKVSADVRLSSNKTNILEKDNNTLLVRGTTDNITHKGESLEKIIDEIRTPEPYIFNTLQEAIDADLKEGETFLLKESNTYDGQYKLVTSMDELEDRGKYIITYGDKGMAMQNGDVRKALDILVVDDTVTLEEGSLIQPVILHKHNDGYLLEVENDMFLKGGTLGTLKADSLPNASTFTFAIVPTAHAFEITTPIGSTEGVLRLQFNYTDGDKFACYDGTMYNVYLYKAVKPIYKGYYVVTKEGFEVLSLDEVLLNNVNILSSDLHTITHQINSEIEAIQLEIERIKEKVDTFDWYEGD